MKNLASTMKSAMIRLARKEVRAEIEGLRKASLQHRKEIAELKRQVAALQKFVVHLEGQAPRVISQPIAEQEPTARRFNAKGFATHRQRLGLSAEEAGALVEVSAQTIYGWEKGRKPQKQHMEAIVAFRGMGKREARERLAAAQS